MKEVPCYEETIVRRISSVYAIVFGFFIYTVVVPETRAYFGLTSREQLPFLGIGNQANNIVDRMGSGQLSPAQLCNMYKLHRKQHKMCKRSRGVPEILKEAIRLSVVACQQQFRFERWNCTLGQYQRNILKKVKYLCYDVSTPMSLAVMDSNSGCRTNKALAC